MQRAEGIITSTRVDKYVCDALALSDEDIRAIGNDWTATDITWMETAVLLVPRMTQVECDHLMPEVLEYHARVSMRMVSHLHLTVENISRSQWLAASILSLDPYAAKTGAREFREYLIRLAPAKRNQFEQSFCGDDCKMTQLEDFCDMDPPRLVWKCNGRFKDLFIYLAIGFLSAPDHVLGCESMHARWQLLEQAKRAMKLKTLNALLKLTVCVETFGNLPDAAGLAEHLEIARQVQRSQMAEVLRGGVIASGLRKDWIYRDRFNLCAADIDVIKASIGKRQDYTKTPQTAWGMYLRFLFKPNSFYSFDNLNPNIYFYVAELKSLPGREFRTNEDAFGRSLVIAWFEKVDADMDGVMVKPTAADEISDLPVLGQSVAELSAAGGYHPAVAANTTTRQVEIMHETAFLNHNVLQWAAKRSPDPGTPWNFILSDPCDIEQFFFDNSELADCTKICLARKLQIDGGHNDAWRNVQYTSLSKGALLAAHGIVAPLPAPPVPPAPPAPAAAVGAPLAHGPGAHPIVTLCVKVFFNFYIID